MISRDSEIGFFIGLPVGILAGVIIAMIYTQKPGTETRAAIKERAEDFRARIREIAGDRKSMYSQSWKQRQGRPKVKPYASGYE